MTNNGNGTFTIKNTQTGESKIVGANELGNYGLSVPNYKPNLLNTILSTGGAIGGGLLGGAAGVAGGAMIPGADLTGIPEAVGGYAGAVGGAGIGSGAGNAMADFIRSLTGDKSINIQQTLKDTPGQVTSGAASEAIGLPVAKGLGYLAHPIQPFIDMVDKKLASSPKVVDFGQLLKDYEVNVLPKLRQSGFGQKATDAYNELSANITDAVSAFKNPASKSALKTEVSGIPNEVTPAVGMSEPSRYGYNGPLRDPIPLSNTTSQNVSSMELPISQANQLKRNLSQQVSDYYGFDTGKPNIEANKQFGHLLKTNIEQQVPGVNTMGPGNILPGGNKVASALYNVPNTADALMRILSLGQPQVANALGKVGNLPFKAIQKVIPSNGGYLRQLLPGLFQTGSSLNSQDQGQ